jgi:hypothetical protein
VSINVPLLRKTLEYITEHPEEHDQEMWGLKTRCGTTYCLAGHAVQLAGHEIAWPPPCCPECDGREKAAYLCADGRDIAEVAREELGLARDQAWCLFNSGKTLFGLWFMAREFTNGEIEIPEQFR